MKSLVAIALMLGLFTLSAGSAVADESVVRIGILTDMNGPFSDYGGSGSVQAAKLAVEDFGGKVNGKPIEIVSADHLLKPDVAVGILRQWYDTGGVDVVVDLVVSSVALAAIDLTREKNKVAINTGSAAIEFYREKCSPNSIAWTLDNYVFGHSLANFFLKNTGKKKWFILTADYAFGHGLQALMTKTVKDAGGEIVGSVRHPLNTSDFSSFLLQAQGSGADVIAFANAGGDLANSVKQAREFGLDRNLSFVAPAQTLSTVLALGLSSAQGMLAADTTYWDLNAETRAFSERFQRAMRRPPSGGQFAIYGAVTHYLKAVAAVGSPVNGAAVVAKMKELPISDSIYKGYVRADGRAAIDILMSTIKSPAESKGPFDVYKPSGFVPAAEAFAPLEGSPCPLVR